MKKRFGRLTALLLTCIMLFSLVPVTAFADVLVDEVPGEEEVVEVVQEEVVPAPPENPAPVVENNPVEEEKKEPVVEPVVQTEEIVENVTTEPTVDQIQQNQPVQTEEQPAPKTYTVVYKVAGMADVRHENNAATAEFPAPPSGTDGYTWSYTDDNGVAQSFLWTDAARPQTVGERDWELTGSAPVVVQSTTVDSGQKTDKAGKTPATYSIADFKFNMNTQDVDGGTVPSTVAVIFAVGEIGFPLDVELVDGSYTLTDEDIVKGQAGLEAALALESKTFTGWVEPAPAVGDEITAETRYEATAEAMPNISVTFTAMGEGMEEPAVASVEVEAVGGQYVLTSSYLDAAILQLDEALEAFGLKVTGWADGSLLDTVVANGDKFVAQTGKREATTYTVSFIVPGAEEETYETAVVPAGQAVPEPKNPPLPEKMSSFLGWYYNEDGALKYDFSTPVNEDFELYAVFSDHYLVMFEGVDGVVFDSQLVARNEKAKSIELKNVPSDEVFQYWYVKTEDGGADVAFDFNTGITNNMTLAPKLGTTYPVFFNSNGGSPVPYQNIQIGKNFEESEETPPIKANAPSREGYQFSHWSTVDPTTTTEDAPPYDFATPVTAPLTLYAVWQGQKVGYTLVFWHEKENYKGDSGTDSAADPGENVNNYTFSKSIPVGKGASEFVSGQVLDDDDIQALLTKHYNTAKANNLPLTYSEFRFSDVDTPDGVTIDGGGNTVINVYYRRMVFTVKFMVAADTCKTSSVSGLKWAKYQDGPQIPKNSTTPIYEFKGKYQMDITELFPKSDQFTNNEGYSLSCWYVMENTHAGANRNDEHPHSSLSTYPDYLIPNDYATGGREISIKSNWLTEAHYLYRQSYFTLTEEEAADYVEGTAEDYTPYVTYPDGIYSAKKPFEYIKRGEGGIIYRLQPDLMNEGAIGTSESKDVKNLWKWTPPNATFATDYPLNKTNSGATVEYTYGTDENGNTHIIVYYFYDRVTPKVTLNPMGGSLSGKTEWTVSYGSKIQNAILKDTKGTEMPEPKKGTMKFEGWYLDSAFTTKFDKHTLMPGSDVVLYAKYSATDFKVTFYTKVTDSDFYKQADIGSGQTVAGTGIAPTDFVVGTGYENLGTFRGWGVKTPNTLSVSGYNLSAGVYADLDLYGMWDTDGFTISYDLNGGLNNDDAAGTVPTDDSSYDLGILAPVASPQEVLHKGDNHFVGWQMDGQGAIYYPNTSFSINSDVEFVAFYAPKSSLVTLTYHPNYDGTTESPIETQVMPGTEAMPLSSAAFKQAGYDLVGWSKTKGGTVIDYNFGEPFAITAAGPTDLYAVWEKQTTYTVTFKVETGQEDWGSLVVGDQKMDKWAVENIMPGALFSDAVGPFPGLEANEGYRIVGWKPANGPTRVTRNQEYIAVFAKIIPVDFSEMAKIADTSKTYSQKDPLFTFSAWPDGVIKEHFDVKWSRIEGETVDKTYTISAIITPKKGYEGWYDVTKSEAKTGVLTINKLDLTLRPADNRKEYDNDSSNPSPVTTVSEEFAEVGNLLGAADNFTRAEPAYTVAREKKEDVGDYDITISYVADSDANKNYNITALGSTFTITAKPISLAGLKVEDATKVYGTLDAGVDFALDGWQAEFADLAAFEEAFGWRVARADAGTEATANATKADKAGKNEDVTPEGGGYQLALEVWPLNNASGTQNYTISADPDPAEQGVLEVTKRTVTATAIASRNVKFGTSKEDALNGLFSYETADFVFGESVSDIAIGAVSTEYTAEKSAGSSWPVTLANGPVDDAKNTNYNVVGSASTILVESASLILTGLTAEGTKQYGDADLPLVYDADDQARYTIFGWPDRDNDPSMDDYIITFTRSGNIGVAGADENVGLHKTVSINVQPKDPANNNYTITQPAANAGTLNITAAPLVIQLDKAVQVEMDAPFAVSSLWDKYSVTNAGPLQFEENLADVMPEDWSKYITTDYKAGDPVTAAGYPTYYKGSYGGNNLPTLANYDLEILDGNIEVTARTLSLGDIAKFEDSTKVYGAADKDYDDFFTFNSVLTADEQARFKVTYSRDAGENVAAGPAAGGKYVVTATIAVADDMLAEYGDSYTFASATLDALLEIQKKDLTAAIDPIDDVTYSEELDWSKITYAYAGFVENITVNGVLLNDDASVVSYDGYTAFPDELETDYEPFVVGVTTDREQGKVGTYSVTLQEGIASNYNVPDAAQTFNVVPKELDVTEEVPGTDSENPLNPIVYVNDQSKTYSENDPNNTVKWPAGYDISQFDINYWRDNGADSENVGRYAIAASVKANTGNYTVAGAAENGTLPEANFGVLTINKLPVTLTPTSGGKIYGVKDPDPIANVQLNFADVDSPMKDFVKAAVNSTVTRALGEDVGNYPITVTPGENPNYAVEVAPGTFTISPVGSPVVINMGNFTKLYGNEDPTNEELMNSISVANLTGGDTMEDLNIQVTRQPGENVGTYNYIINYDGSILENYSGITVNAGTLTINKRIIILHANSYPTDGGTLYPTDSLPNFEAFLDPGTPLVNGDTQLEYSVHLTDYSGTGTPGAGTYTIGISANPDAELNKNYDIWVYTGTLTITAPVVIDDGGDPDPIITPAIVTPVTPPVIPLVDVDLDDDVVAPEPVTTDPAAPLPEPTTPQAAPDNTQSEPLADAPVPQAGPAAQWALLNLMVAILTLVLAVILFATLFKRNKKRDETEEEKQARMAMEAANGEEPEEDVRNRKSGILWRIISILAGILAPIVFLITENMRNPMVFADRWTLLMVLILVVQVIGMLLMKHARNKEENLEEDGANA